MPPQLKRDLNLSDDVGVITSDTTNPKDADSLAKQAKVIITTVGPFRCVFDWYIVFLLQSLLWFCEHAGLGPFIRVVRHIPV